MIKTKTLALNKQNIIALTQFAALLAISILAPFFHFQPITGPIVNAMLFIAVVLLGAQAGIMLGLLPSLVALSIGTLPAPLAPMIPFIMVSNAILVLVFAFLKKEEVVKLLPERKEFNYFLSSQTSFQTSRFFIAVITASVLKFLFLFSTSFIVLRLISQKPIAQKAAIMMSWPQLATALLGGLLAFIFLKLTLKDKMVK